MGKSKAPKPPDPNKTAGAQTATNIGTAIANSQLQMVDQFTPEGSLTYNQSGTYQYTDPNTGKVHDIPRYSATTALSPEQQAIFDQGNRAEQNLAGTAADQSEFLRSYLGEPADFDTQEIEGRLDELGRQRLDPRFERESNDLQTRLANQGITPGSEAYNREMDRLAYNKNDAYNNLYLQGRGQAFNELAAKRNQPINEITALLSGSQVNMPNVSPITPQGAATTDVAGIIGQNYNQRLGAWQQNQQSRQGLLGGLFGAGATLLGAPQGSILGGFF